jgi:hypothetical protein
MIGHYFTMHTNDPRDRVWVECSCGWTGPIYLIQSDDDSRTVPMRAYDEARQHTHLTPEVA